MTFETMARRARAVDVHDFKQVQFLRSVTGEPHPQGKCFAFVLAYITCLRTGVAGKHLLESLELAMQRNDQSVIREILGDQNRVSSKPVWMGTDLFNIQLLQKELAQVYAGIGLEKQKERRFDDRFCRNLAVGRYIVASTPVYSIIKSRVHIMAAVSHPTPSAKTIRSSIRTSARRFSEEAGTLLGLWPGFFRGESLIRATGPPRPISIEFR